MYPTTLHIILFYASQQDRSSDDEHSLRPGVNASNMGPLASFGEMAAERFHNDYPQLTEYTPLDCTQFVAALHLFRFDPRLSSEFIQSRLDDYASTLATHPDYTEKTVRRIFHASMQKAARSYFSTGWDNSSAIIAANIPALEKLRQESARTMPWTDSLQSAVDIVPDVDPVVIRTLIEHDLPVVVRVFAHYCSGCKAMKPAFDQAAIRMQGQAIFVELNGPMAPEFKAQYAIKTYPTVLRFHKSNRPTVFPRAHEMDVENFVLFAAGEQLELDGPDTSLQSMDTALGEEIRKLERKRSRLQAFQLESILRRQGIDELDVLVRERSEMLHSKIDDALQCGASSCDVLSSRCDSSPSVAPLCVLLGGGMGAGKTTAVKYVAETAFWKQHGDGVVVVEADAFKQKDPLFHVLNSMTPLASRIVHSDSIIAAEEQFLEAINKRKDVVFDGTLSWKTYAVQMFEMLRDTEYTYKRGPGYRRDENGTVTELYWERKERRKKAVAPYQVELVGVTADADVAVMRGLIRRLTSGRGVPIGDQLKSHKLFSTWFKHYIDLVDAIYLFDTTEEYVAGDDKDDGNSRLVAIKGGELFATPSGYEAERNGLAILRADKYEQFLKKSELVTNASGVDSLYAAQR